MSSIKRVEGILGKITVFVVVVVYLVVALVSLILTIVGKVRRRYRVRIIPRFFPNYLVRVSRIYFFGGLLSAAMVLTILLVVWTFFKFLGIVEMWL